MHLTIGGCKTPIFPKSITVDGNGITTFDRRGVILFWLSDEERMNARQISSVRIKKGILWDLVTVDTTGGTNVLQIHGMNKSKANALRNDIQALIDAQYGQPMQQMQQCNKCINNLLNTDSVVILTNQRVNSQTLIRFTSIRGLAEGFVIAYPLYWVILLRFAD